jgi:hypothetical protein
LRPAVPLELLDVLDHPNPERYQGHRMIVMPMVGYVHLVSYVETEQHLLIKHSQPTEPLDALEQQWLDGFSAGRLRSVATPEHLEELIHSARAHPRV